MSRANFRSSLKLGDDRPAPRSSAERSRLKTISPSAVYRGNIHSYCPRTVNCHHLLSIPLLFRGSSKPARSSRGPRPARTTASCHCHSAPPPARSTAPRRTAVQPVAVAVAPRPSLALPWLRAKQAGHSGRRSIWLSEATKPGRLESRRRSAGFMASSICTA